MHSHSSLRWIPAALAVLLLTAKAQTGAFADREAARAAELAADKRIDAVEQRYAEAQARCTKEFFSNDCLERARRTRNAEREAAQRERLHARDALRAFDAAERAARPAPEKAQPRVPEAATPRAPSQPHAPLVSPQSAAEQERERRERAAAAAERARRSDERRRAHQAELAGKKGDAAERAANVKAFEEKQRAAAEHAKQVEAKRAENQRKRAQRTAEREAQQEALRKKAE